MLENLENARKSRKCQKLLENQESARISENCNTIQKMLENVQSLGNGRNNLKILDA